MPCETHVDAAPTSDVAAVYFFSGRSSGSSPSEASPCAAVTWRPTPVAMASAPSVANVPLNASRRLNPFFKRSPTNSSSSPASGPRCAISPIGATSTWTDRSSVPATTAGNRCAASPRNQPGSPDRHASRNFGPKRETGLNSRQASYGLPPGNTLQTLFLPRHHGGLSRILDRLLRALDGITRSWHRQRQHLQRRWPGALARHRPRSAP